MICTESELRWVKVIGILIVQQSQLIPSVIVIDVLDLIVHVVVDIVVDIVVDVVINGCHDVRVGCNQVIVVELHVTFGEFLPAVDALEDVFGSLTVDLF